MCKCTAHQQRWITKVASVARSQLLRRRINVHRALAAVQQPPTNRLPDWWRLAALKRARLCASMYGTHDVAYDAVELHRICGVCRGFTLWCVCQHRPLIAQHSSLHCVIQCLALRVSSYVYIFLHILAIKFWFSALRYRTLPHAHTHCWQPSAMNHESSKSNLEHSAKNAVRSTHANCRRVHLFPHSKTSILATLYRSHEFCCAQ